MRELLARQGGLPDVLITTAYVLLAGVLDALREAGDWPEGMRVGTFGDTQLLDFLPLPVNSMYQQHELIAEQVLALALAAVEQEVYEPGVRGVARRLKER
ncbi:Catabolite repressor/activator [compost metagenome]